MNAVREPRRQPEPEKTRRSGPRHVSAWREHHMWSLSISLRRLGARPLGTLLTVAVMGVALALPLAFYLLLGNVQRMGDALGRNQSISVFMKPGQTGAMADIAASALRGRPEVAEIVVRTPKDGLDELAEVQGFSGSLQSLDVNPLPYVLSVQPKAGLAVDQVDRLVEAMKATPGVDLVQDTGAWRQRLDALLGVGTRAVSLLALLLGVAALLVVGNTIRVDIQSRSDEIGVLLLIGASRPFVRRPYLYAGIWLGLLAGILAVILAVVLELAMAGPVGRLTAAYDGSVSFGGLPAWLLLSVPFASALLGWLGARLVSARQIRRAAMV
ncbi:cell division protein [Luteibacter rhizovicinus DSM 16549]|uniref:Cell division protein FtsX n=1 Tax=Luteibacter rhizovicinus DSM 16549 TaxID=1440763 RepID=A0A0G9H645_9GAMM|nr:permease-like cell division protein FtsX [Luteibacter rhizovicinus]APG03387.1 cell division protein [Luteibacter rhizovicinus DSM 16549]KLD65295.1 cell division protein [Luteibacter rhizovicinus DSM 16549]KLD80052.1 cell division protein [Xanthomonas hyacinthi DSM 19077]